MWVCRFWSCGWMAARSGVMICTGLTTKLSDRRWREGLSVKGGSESPHRTEQRGMAAVGWS